MKFDLLTGGQEIKLAILVTFLAVILSVYFIFFCLYSFYDVFSFLFSPYSFPYITVGNGFVNFKIIK